MSRYSLDTLSGKILYYLLVVGAISLFFYLTIANLSGQASVALGLASTVLGAIFGSMAYGLFLAWRSSVRSMKRAINEYRDASEPARPSQQQLQVITSLDPSKPVFSYSYAPSVIYYLATEVVFFLIYFPVIVGFSQGTLYTIAVSVAFAATFLYAAARRWFVKVRAYKFYQNHFELSGWRFKRQFSYQDISKLILRRRGFWVLAEPFVMFTIKDDPTWLGLKNLRNKQTDLNLYNWLATKAPSSARLTSSSSIFQ